VASRWLGEKTPLIEKLEQLQAETPIDEPFRIVGIGSMMFPNLTLLYGFEDVRAHDPMSIAPYVLTLRLITGYEVEEYHAHWRDVQKRFLDFLNVRYILLPLHAEPPERFTRVYHGSDGWIAENPDVLPRFFPVRQVFLEERRETFHREMQSFESWATGAWLNELEPENERMRREFLAKWPADAPMAKLTILEAENAHYRLHVRAPRYTLVVSSIPWWPGWKVQRNGVEFQPIRVNGGFLGFAVPEGEVDVRVWYDPWTFRLGAIASSATLAVLIALGLLRRRKPMDDSSARPLS
jgi:hypothetical protein